MSHPDSEPRKRLSDLLNEWRRDGVPPRTTLMNCLKSVIDWKNSNGYGALWPAPPLMVTATLDDCWGHGLEVIHTCAEAAGLQVDFLGLLQTPEKIIEECRLRQPDLLGLTVLQLDSDEALRQIADNLPAKTRILAGGPPFKIDEEFAERAGVQIVCHNVSDFLDFLLVM